MKKSTLVAIMLAMFAPVAQVWAGGGGSTTYDYSATVSVSASGNGTVYVGTTNPPTDKSKKSATQSDSKSSDTSKTYTFYAVAEPAEGYEFNGWTGGADNASSATTPVTVSLSSSTTSKTISLTASFNKIVTFDGAEYVIDENGGDLATLLGTVQAGDTIIINKDVTIEKGVSLAIPADIQVTISSGKKLTVKGNLSIHSDARLVGDGTLAHSWKTITQAADVHIPFPLGTDGVSGTGNGIHTVDGTAGKYLVTSVTEENNVSGSFTCKEEFFVTIDNKSTGDSYYSKSSTTKPIGVLCTVAREKALNSINGVSDTIYTDCATLLTAAATPTSAAVSGNKHSFRDTNKLAVLTGAAGTVTYDGTSSSSSTKLAFAVDLAGTSITLSTGKQWNSSALVRFFNGSVTISQKVMNTNFCFYNCTGTISYLSLNSADYVTAAYLYESPKIKITFSDKQSTSSGEQCFFGGGPYSTSYVSFNTTVSDKQSFNKVYWGTFDKNMNPTAYLYDTNKIGAEQDSSQNNAWVVYQKMPDPNSGEVKVNGEDSTLAKALANAVSGDVIVLQRDIAIEADLTVSTSASNVLLDLNGWQLTGSNAIINNGDMEIIDVNGNGQIDIPIINNGTLLLSSAKYNGLITLKGGCCYFLAGTFNGGVSVASNVADPTSVAEIYGGTYTPNTYTHGAQTKDLVGLCDNGYVKDGAIAQIPVSQVSSSSFASYTLSALSSSEQNLYTRGAARSGYTREEWITLNKLKASANLFGGFGVDCAITVDRCVEADDLSVTKPYPFDISVAISANNSYSALFQAMRQSGMASAPWTYGSILPGGEHDGSMNFALSNKAVQNGTFCLIEMRLATGVKNLSGPKDWSYTEYVTTAKRKLVLGAGTSNKAMIRPATGAATFYSTLGAAMNAVADGGTVMLANDCDTALPITKVGTYTFDTMGFAHSSDISVADGLVIKSTTVADSSVKAFIPDAIATTYEVVQTVAKVGDQSFYNLTDAVAFVLNSGEVVTLLADTNESVVLNKGQSLKLALASGVSYSGAVTCSDDKYIVTTTAESGYTLYKTKFNSSAAVIVKASGEDGEENGYDTLAEALSNAESGSTATLYWDLVLADSAVVPKGVTLTIDSGATLTVNGTLAVAGTLSVAGTVNGSGAIYKVSQIITQGDVKTLYDGRGDALGKMALRNNTSKPAKYRTTTVTANTPTISGTVGITPSWGVLLNSDKAFAITTQNPYALAVTLKTTACVNEITAITGTITANSITASGNYVLLQNCNLTGPMGTETAGSSTYSRLQFTGTIDLAGKKITNTSNMISEMCTDIFLNGSVEFGGASSKNYYVQQSKMAFFNCSSVTLRYIKNDNANFYFYDCGTSDSPATITFTYYSTTRTTDWRNAYFYCGYYNYTFNTKDDSGKCFVYGGSYKSDPASYLQGTDLEAPKVGDYYVVQKIVPPAYAAQVGSTQYLTLQEAVDAAANSGGTVEILLALQESGLENPVTIPAGKTVTIDLSGMSVSAPDGAIVNNGTLYLQDTHATPGTISTASGNVIVNNGAMDVTYGTYSGNILLNSGSSFTTHGGTFTGTLTAASGTDPKEVANLRGGTFSQNVASFLRDGFVQKSGKVGEYPYADVSSATISGAEAAWKLTLIGSSDKTIYAKGSKAREVHSSVADWRRYAELYSALSSYVDYTPEGVVTFDRATAGGTVTFYGKVLSQTLNQSLQSDVAANESYPMVIRLLKANGVATPYLYSGYIEELESLTIGIKGASANNGTVATTELQFWQPSNMTVGEYMRVSGLEPLARTRYMLGGKKAAIDRGASRLAYDSLAAAVSAAQSGERILVGADTAENVTLPGAGTFTIDPYGFAFTGTVSIPNTCFLKSQTEVASSATAQGVTSAKAVTYVVALKVAQVDETFYDNLTEAVAAANGGVVTLWAATDETITLTTEGQSFTLNKNGVAFEDSQVVTTLENGSVTVADGESGTVYTAVTSIVEANDGHKYNSVAAAVADVPGNDISVTITANDTESVELPQGKSLTVTTAPGVTVELTVTPADGAFLEESVVEGGTKYESKKITVEMAEPQSAVAVSKIEGGTESDVTDSEEINAAVAKLESNHDVPRTDNTDKLDVLDVITVTPTKIVEEVVGGNTIIRSATFDVVPNLKSGQTLGAGQTLKFRLPVDAAATQLAAIVYHADEQFGIYPVQTYAGEKFIEVESADFSPYTYELLDGETANPIAAIGTTGYATLDAALTAAVNGDTINVFAGTFAMGSDTIVVNKEVTITGAGKDTTTLNFTATGKAAFSIQASNVTIEDMTINQADTGTYNTYHIGIDAAGSNSCYSNVTISNLRLEGGKYSMFVYGESFIINGCDFASQESSQILVDATKGNSRITNNTFTGGKYNVLQRNSHSPTTVTSSGKLTIGGNSSSNGNLLYILESASTIDTAQKMELAIVDNEVVNYSNKAIAFTPTDELGKYCSAVTITNNAFYTTASNRPVIQRDDSERATLTIDASGNYWGSSTPDFVNPITEGGSKYLIMPHTDSNIAFESFGTSYTSKNPGATVNDLLYKVTFVDDDGETELFATNVAVGASAIYGGETPAKAATDQYTYTWTGWTYNGAAYGTSATLAPVADATQTYTATYSSEVNDYTVTVTIPANTTITVKQNGETIQPDAGTDNQFTVPYGTELTVEYAASGAYIAGGTQSQTVTADSTKTVAAPNDYTTTAAVAQIGPSYYPSLAAAVAAASAGDTITMLADDNVSLTSGGELVIDKSLTITGLVDEDGDSLYTIYGTANATGSNRITIDGNGMVTLSNLKIAGFGKDHATDASHAPVYVASTFTGTVNLDNLHISDFNRGGVFLYGGAFNVTDCYIDCANDGEGAFTKGIEIRNDAAGTIADSTIVNMTSESDESVACGVEFYGNGAVTVSGCTIEGDTMGAVGIGTAGFTDTTTTGTITVDDCEITVYYAALYASVLGEGLGENGTTIEVMGGTYTADNYAVSALYGAIAVEGGEFYGMLEAGDVEYGESGSLSISGGLFEDEIYEAYCADGYIPTFDEDSDLYTVKQGAYVAAVYDDGGDLVSKYETLAEALSGANAGDTITLLTDVALDEAVDISESVTLDLNGKTVSISAANEDGYAISVSAGTVTITGNGTIDAGDDIALDVAGGSVTIANGTFGVVGVDDGNLTITAGTFNGGLLTVDGTTIINGGTFNDVVDVGGGSVAIYGGAFTAADNVLMVTDAGGSLIVNGGTFAATQSGDGEPIVVYVEGGTASLTAGTFTGGTIATDAAETGTLTVSGGSFSAAVPEEYCANGYIPTAQDSVTGLYTVKTGAYVARNVTTGLGYETLYSAVNAATAGDTVTLLADVEESLTISKNLTLTGDYKITGSTRFDAGASVTISGLTFDANGVIYAMNIAGGSSVDLQNVTVGGGQWCNIHLNNGTLTGTGVTMRGDEIVVAADGQTYTYRGETFPKTDAPWGLDVSKIPGKTLNVPYMDIVRESGSDTVTLSDPLTPAGSILFVANMPEDETLTGVTLPDRFSGYTLTLDADIAFFGGAEKPVTGWTAGNWNEFIDTGAIALVALDENPAEVPVELELNSDVDLGDGDSAFEFRYPNLTIDGNGNAVSGTIKYTDNAGVVSNAVLGTADSPLVIDLTQTTEMVDLGGGIVVEKVVVLINEDRAVDGTVVFDWGTDADAPTLGQLEVTVVNGDGTPTGEEATLAFDMEEGIAYIGSCTARLTGPTHEAPIYTSLENAISRAAQSGDTITLLANVEASVTIRKSLTLTGDYTITGTMKVTDGASVVLNGITLDANGMIYALDIAGGASVAMTNVTVGGGQWCNVHVNGGTLTGTGVTMLGDEIAVAADGQTYTYRGETLDASDAPFGMDLSKVKGETVTLPFMDIVRENGDETVSLSDAQDKPLTQAGSILYLANMPGNDSLDGVTLPERFYNYTLTIEADIGFLGDGTTPTTGWAAGDWNEIIDTGALVLDAIGEDSEEVPVLLTLNDDTDLGEDPFEFRYGNLTVDGDGNVLSGKIIYTDDAGVVSNTVLGTADSPLVIDLTQTTEMVDLGGGIVVENVVVLINEDRAVDGTVVFDWGADGDAPTLGQLVVTVVDANGTPTGEEASLAFDMEEGIAYIGSCTVRLTGPTHEAPIYTSLANAISQAAQSGDTITLMTNIVDFAGTEYISKSLTLDGAGHTITASAAADGAEMFDVTDGAVVFKDITLDGAHKYTYCVQTYGTANLTLDGVTILHGAKEWPGTGFIYGAGVHVNGGNLVVTNAFTAFSGGKADEAFPFTGILYDDGGLHFADGVTASIANPAPNAAAGDTDLLLVGLVGAPDVSQPEARAEVQEMLDYMNVPDGFYPYTLKIDPDNWNDNTSFTGASPLGWNDIIDYGKAIMDAVGMSTNETPVEVGLLENTEIPGTFRFEDGNFTVNGNGYELTGTLEYTASAGELKNVVLTSDTVLDISAEGATVNFGEGVSVAEGEKVKLVIGELSAGQDLADNVGDLTINDFDLYVHDTQTDALVPVAADNIADYLPEGYEIDKIVEEDGTTKDLVVVKKKYTVSWLDDAGGEIDTTTVEHGDVPTHADAVKADSGIAFYTFAGWADTLGGPVLSALPAATNDAAYYAVFTEGAYVAQVVTDGGALTNCYTSLADALAAVPADGTETTVQMITNSAETASITVAAGKNVVLDLNGKTVSYTSAAKDAIFITNSGTLTIEDSSENETGVLQLTAVPDTGYSVENVTVYNVGGTLTLVSGTIRNATAGGLSYAVNNSSNAWGSDVVSTFNMIGGTITAPSGDAALRVYQNCSAKGSVLCKNYVNISGGTILDTGIFVDAFLYTDTGVTDGFEDSIDTQINISGGVVNGLIDMKLRHKNNMKLNITGGDFTNAKLWVRKVAAEYKFEEPAEPVVSISGGKFAFVTGMAFGLAYDCGATSWSTYDKPYAVSGGVFNVAVPEEFCAEGYIPADNADAETAAAYPYTVVVAPNYVAQIVTGTTTNKYVTLADAIAAVPADGTETTVQMITNSAETASITVAAGKNVVLDLNGKTVSYTSAAKDAIFITNSGTLTIEDSSENETGVLQLTAVPDTGYSVENVTVYNVGGTLTLVSGTIRNATAGGLSYAVNNSSNAWGSDVVSTFNMIGGTITAPSGDAALRVYQNCSAKGSVLCKNYVNISGGTILDTGIFVDAFLYTDTGVTDGFEDSIDTQINISGGVVNGLIDMKLRHKNNMKLNITGGDFTNAKLWVRKVAAEYKFEEPAEPVVSISGGKFAFVTGMAFGLAYDCGATSWSTYDKPYAVSGGVFNVAVPEEFCAEGYIPADNADTETAAAYPYTVINTTTYEIVWVSEGEVLATNTVFANTVPVYSGETPRKTEHDAGEFYVFSGWTPDLGPAVSNTTYTATFTAVETCEIRWMAGDDVVKSVIVTNGTPAAVIASMAPANAGFGTDPDPLIYHNVRFTGWDPASYVDATEDAVYTAQFENIYHVSGIVPGTLHFTSIKANGRKVAVTFEFKPTGKDADAYRLIYKTALDSAETYVSDIANVTVLNGDANSWTAIAEVTLPEGCEAKAFVTGLDFNELSGE